MNKICSHCLEEKPLDCFHKDRSKKHGVRGYCKKCDGKIRKERYLANRDKALEGFRQNYLDNREERLSKALKYQKEHSCQTAAIQSRRRAKQVSSSILNNDEWNNFVIKELYELRKARSDETGFPWHVDHVVPLQGKNVSGLHVWYNLQLLPASLNFAKSNRFEGA